MSDVQKDDAGPMIAWQCFAPFPTTVRQVEDLQGAVRGDIALVDEAQKKAQGWMERRQLAYESGLKALSEISACKDPVSAVAIYGGWLSGSMDRIAADLKEAQDFAIKVAAVGQQTAQAMVEGYSPSGGTAPDRVAGAA